VQVLSFPVSSVESWNNNEQERKWKEGVVAEFEVLLFTKARGTEHYKSPSTHTQDHTQYRRHDVKNTTITESHGKILTN
jgi:predicted RNA-binding protein